MRFLSSFAVSVVFFLNFLAPTVSAENAPASDQLEARALLGTALDAADRSAAQRWAFSLRATEFDETGGQRTYIYSFDPRRAVGERWEPLAPTLEDMTKGEKKEFKEFSKEDNADEQLVYDGLKAYAQSAQIVSDDGAVIQFRGALPDDDMPVKIRDALEMDIFLERASGTITDIVVEAIKPFKPVAVAKVKEMKQVQSFAPVGPGEEILLVRSVSKARGKAMLVSFSTETVVEFFDFVPVDGPPFPESEEPTSPRGGNYR